MSIDHAAQARMALELELAVSQLPDKLQSIAYQLYL